MVKKLKKITKFSIFATDNSGQRREIKDFGKESQANQFLKKLLSPGKTRTIITNGKRKIITLTSFREGISGTGINNPRIKKIKIPKRKFR